MLDKEKERTTDRKYGIDLLRMLLMFMVVVLHVQGKGGILKNAEIGSVNYYLAWIIEISCYCAVNCYALITGYVYYSNKYRISSLLMICLQTVLYSISIHVVFWIIDPSRISFGQLLNAFFPVSRHTHWYVSAYAGLFILIPILNTAVQSFSLYQTKRFLLLSFVAFSLITTFLMEDPYTFAGGYSTLWLAYLYLIGGFIKKYHWESYLTQKNALLVFALCIALTLGFKFSVDSVTLHLFGEPKFGNLLANYVSPTIIIAGIALFIKFLRLCPNAKTCSFLRTLSPAAFGVYLIHCHPYLFELLSDRFVFLIDWNPLTMPFGVIAFSMAIYLPCLLVDYLRLKLFKMLHIKECLEKLENRLSSSVFDSTSS